MPTRPPRVTFGCGSCGATQLVPAGHPGGVRCWYCGTVTRLGDGPGVVDGEPLPPRGGEPDDVIGRGSRPG